MTEYTRELSKDILERLQTQRIVGNQTGASQADVSITEALTLLAEIERLKETTRKAELNYGLGMSQATANFIAGSATRPAKSEAWEACADKAYELYLTEEQRDELLAANPYRKEETK